MKRFAIMMVGLAAFAQAAQAEPLTTTLDQGRALLGVNCQRCHNIGHEGTSAHPQAPPFREVVKKYPPEHLAEALAEGIISGHPDMPEFVFAPNQVDAIVTYLDSLAVRKDSERSKQ